MSELKVNGLAESGPRNVLSIVAALNARAGTGILRFEPAQEPEYVVEFLFREGRLLFATTNRPGQRLGEFLVRRGALSSAQATAALLEARRRTKLFHEYVADQALLERSLLEHLLYERAEELLHAVLGAQAGRFVFEQTHLVRFNDRVPLVDDQLFARLVTFRNLWTQSHDKLWAHRPMLRQVPHVLAQRWNQLSPDERKVLEQVDDRIPVQRLLEGRRDRVDLAIRLMQMLDAGLVEVAAWDSKPVVHEPRVEPANTPPPKALDAAARAAAAAQADLLDIDSAPLDLELLPALRPGTELTKITISGLSMDDLFLISQIDGSTSLRQLMNITRIPEKSLLRLIHHLVRKGYAELRPQPVSGPPVRSVRAPSRVSATLSKPYANTTPAPPSTSSPSHSAGPAHPPTPPPPPPVEPARPAPPPVAVHPEKPEPRPMPAWASRSTAAPPQDPKDEALRLHDSAIEAFNSQNFQSAEKLLRKAVHLDRETPRLRAHLALAMAQRPDQMTDALRLVEEAFEQDPLDSHCLEAMGYIRLKLGDNGKAAQLLQTALLLDRKKVPSSARVLDELRSYQPKRGAKPEEFWAKIRPNIRLKA